MFRNQNGFHQQNNILLVMKIILFYFIFRSELRIRCKEPVTTMTFGSKSGISFICRKFPCETSGTDSTKFNSLEFISVRMNKDIKEPNLKCKLFWKVKKEKVQRIVIFRFLPQRTHFGHRAFKRSNQVIYIWNLTIKRKRTKLFSSI